MGGRVLHDPVPVVGHRFSDHWRGDPVPDSVFLANQIRMARKNFSDAVWFDWVDRASRRQLRKAIESGGYLVTPHAAFAGMREAAATDVDLHCGLEKRICVSHWECFLVRHLRRNAEGILGTPEREFAAQLAADGQPRTALSFDLPAGDVACIVELLPLLDGG